MFNIIIAKRQNKTESMEQLEGDETALRQESIWEKKKRDLDR